MITVLFYLTDISILSAPICNAYPVQVIFSSHSSYCCCCPYFHTFYYVCLFLFLLQSVCLKVGRNQWLSG